MLDYALIQTSHRSNANNIAITRTSTQRAPSLLPLASGGLFVALDQSVAVIDTMALPEFLTNSKTPGTREAYTTLSAELKTGETTMKWTAAPPTSCHGTGAAGIGGQFRVVIGSEIILCEAGESTTVKIIGRKEEGSTEAAHLIAAQVWIVPTAEGVKLTSGSLTEVITSTKKWIKPKGAQSCAITVIGGGGGGGSGAAAAEKIEVAGGGGGGGGAANFWVFPASTLASEVECTIGGGGAGGASRSTEGEGEAGKNGTKSHFGELLFANGGELGKGGKTTTGGSGGGVIKGQFPGNAAGTGAPGAGAEAPGPTGGGAGGGGGGGGSSTTEAKKGGAGGFSYLGSETRAAENAEGAEGLAESGIPGGGGGGGKGGFDASATAGGKGGKYGGGGGGGGGCSKVGSTTGAGGKGGEGVIVIVTEF